MAGIACTTLADPREPRVRRRFARYDVLGAVGPWLLSPSARLAGEVRLPIRWLSRMHAIANDPQLTELICRDPFGGDTRVPLRFLESVMEGAPAVEPEDFDVCPVLLAHPGDDRWTSVELSRLLFDRIAAPTELVLLERCGHFPIEPPGIGQLDEALRGFLARVAS